MPGSDTMTAPERCCCYRRDGSIRDAMPSLRRREGRCLSGVRELEPAYMTPKLEEDEVLASSRLGLESRP